MSAFNCQTPGENGEIILSDEPLGRGGEGSVFTVKSHTLKSLPPANSLVGKIYHGENDEEKRVQKIVAMIRKTPDSDSIAWPQALIIDDRGVFRGYVMDKLSYDTYRMWAEIAHAQQRKDNAGKFDVRYAITVALNLAYALEAVHDAGHRVGDINESNIFVSNDARVLLVDTDSAQIDKNGKDFFPCLVGKPEYTAPELSHGPLKTQERTIASDIFGYSVAIYQLLVGGAHPTDGIYSGDDDPISVTERQRQEIYPNFKESNRFKKVGRIPTDGIPSRVRAMIRKGISSDPNNRPLLQDFEECLEDVLNNLVQCKKVKTHWYDKRDKKCGWCEHSSKGFPDPWNLSKSKVNPKKKPTQKTLPPISFAKESPKQSNSRTPQRVSQNTNTTSPKASIGGIKLGKRNSGATQANQKPSGNLPELGKTYQQRYVDMPKHKGKTILSYVDGTKSVRPSYSSLLSANRAGLARQCFSNEMPSFMRLAWHIKSQKPNKNGILIGGIIGVILSLSWWILVPMIFKISDPLTHLQHYIDSYSFIKTLVYYLTVASMISALLAVFFTVYYGLSELKKIQDLVQYHEFYPVEKSQVSIIKVALKGLIYGPFFVIFFIIMIISFTITAMGESNKR